MTSVRQKEPATRRRKGSAAPEGRATGVDARRAGSASSIAQVRLQADEFAELRAAMQQLSLTTTSEALREGVRLLVREAREIATAGEIQRFYGGQPAPLPEGVAPVTEEELALADNEQW
ncbi:hypothetical protein GCM10010123_34570 [Pilimelia anulata]|uniref:Uncharacterized protein n=1 Tax=Pilimelia anulata TaxID=53371 RepID=A0A8J3BAX3_9ACTN|nr:hypothetical protein [Pilimelia anulata]GGK01753.1 hypothetical protein GCM10010123_34570 [Pilimelia anulata]